MEENTSLHTECAHKPRPAVLNQFSRKMRIMFAKFKSNARETWCVILVSVS